jgi:hypothetical protein
LRHGGWRLPAGEYEVEAKVYYEPDCATQLFALKVTGPGMHDVVLSSK